MLFYCIENPQWHYPKESIHKIWEEIESLRDQIIFVGRNRTLCLDSKLYHGCKGNCICFADDCVPDAPRVAGRHVDLRDKGVYHMDDKRVEYFPTDINDLLPMPAIWFSPNPWEYSKDLFMFS